ncbi:MAG: hypothetical protein KKC68_07720 [Candidatus Thermoplasmatota archaeon]|nr:hypothetical protein [Candidatus Thermoplasmatota archaeon]MBU1941645.1 hypothetical protein [Candidatus Thermoplasmatota archaeon]
MKKTLPIISLLLITLISLPICSANITVHPRELSITMTNDFIHGNTSKTIEVQNHDNYNINISWYLEHPNPPSWIRPNKTTIPNLSWIDVKPRWITASPMDTVSFYIHLNVSENEENLNQQWETWITFYQETSEGLFNQEYAVRMYIDTPLLASGNNTQNHGDAENNDQNIVYLALLATAVVFIIFMTLVYNKKNL